MKSGVDLTLSLARWYPLRDDHDVGSGADRSPGVTIVTSAPTISSEYLCSLVDRMRVGDELAFRHLYDLTSTRVMQAVLRTFRDADHAAEVVQEVFLHAWQEAGAFDSTRGSVVGWLTMLGHRRAVDRVRSVVRSRERDHRSAVEDEPCLPDAAEVALARVQAAELRHAIALLPARQRDALVLTYLVGYSQQDAAHILKVPVGTLKSRVHVGVAALRRHYESTVAA